MLLGEQFYVLAVEDYLDGLLGEGVVLVLYEEQTVGLGLDPARVTCRQLLLVLYGLAVLGPEHLPQRHKEHNITLQISKNIRTEPLLIPFHPNLTPIPEHIPPLRQYKVNQPFQHVLIQQLDLVVLGFVDV